MTRGTESREREEEHSNETVIKIYRWSNDDSEERVEYFVKSKHVREQLKTTKFAGSRKEQVSSAYSRWWDEVARRCVDVC